ncbi:zeta toxin family protein [Halalkalibacter sp. APA_J-10(15)]|uniref:zeta toxin family protein n=1 Tax=unclassified Halalkalibacter TaxID=2893063 RepID=UPI001FF5FDCD|nr:zeta toxin family protein [Halalkalibacter sp. APA_J-10(15)]MCK0470380.1 zeta toxin family protein [Halalkalibacter sp. APA_J-10(15)]
MHSYKPIFFVFAGNNGSGKSTIRNLIIDKIGIDINIDPDAIARRIDPENPEKNRVSAGKEVIKSVNKYIKEGKDFSIETTLAGKNAIKQMQKAKEMGYEITMFYVALNNVHQNIERVAMRVKNGGHHIPTEDIIRRNKTSFKHLYDYAYMIDNLVLIDNSEEDGEIVLEVNNGFITYEATYLPEWTHPVRKQFEKD